MSRPRKAYRLWKKGNVFYYRLPGMPTWKSTGCTRKTDAEREAVEKLKDWVPPVLQPPSGRRLRDFIAPYFVWDSCPRIAERRADGKRISRQHAARQRDLIERYILKDRIADLDLRKITRGDVKDFKARLIAVQGQRRTVNGVLTVLKTVLHDAVDREILKADPCKGIGQIVYSKRAAGVFSAAELGALFPEAGLGPWQDLQDYTAFLLAASCGIRRGEVLALRWRDIDFEGGVLHVEQAWKDDHEVGEPKWGQRREIPLPARAVQRLKALRAASLHVLPESLVFCYHDGTRLGSTWYTGRFHAAMEKAKIDRAARGLKPHSFRHSIATILEDQGQPAEKIRASMGWTNEKTRAGYTHIGAEHLQGQTKIIDGIFG